MTNPLIAARDAFAARHPEARENLNGRDWGVIDTGGGGPVLVLIPGTLGRADIFWQQIAALAPRLRVIAVSYPATGGIVDWTDDIRALLDARGIQKTALLGSSLGGYLAQHVAGTHGDRLTHLFAANTLDTAIGVAARQPYAQDLDNAPIADLRGGFQAAMHAWGQAQPDQIHLVEFLLAEVGGRIPEGEMRARLKAMKHGPELPPPGLPGSAITTIEAVDDPLIPPTMRDGVRARLPGSAGYRFLWGGHFPYVLRPELYTGLIAARLGLAAERPEWAGQEVLQA